MARSSHDRTVAARACNGCKLTIVHEMQPQWAECAPRVEQGWTTMLTAPGKVLA